MGKSRLALELCEWCTAEHWHAGFLGEPGVWPAKWIPVRDTMIVVDYVGARSVGDQPAFRWLTELFVRTHAWRMRGVRVRVVLVDRFAKGPFWMDWTQSEIADDLNGITLSIDLVPDREEFRAIMRDELVRLLKREPSADKAAAADDVACRLHGKYRPLFGPLTARAIAALPRNGEVWSPELLIESVLKSQLRKWQIAGVTDEHLDLLYLATLTQGQYDEASWFQSGMDALREQTLTALSALSEPGQRLGPVVPDLLGEFFVLMRLRGDMALGTRQTQMTIRMAERLFRLAWPSRSTQLYIARTIQDYVPWKPAHGSNPALDMASHALRNIDARYAETYGVRACCLAIAFKRPAGPDWLGLIAGLPECVRRNVAEDIVVGIVHGVSEGNGRREIAAIIDTVDALYRTYMGERVKSSVAWLLSVAARGERDAARVTEIVDRLQAIYDQSVLDPEARAYLASALADAVRVSRDPEVRLANTRRIEALDDGGRDVAVPRALAEPLFHRTANQSVHVCTALADAIREIHDRSGQDAVVRGWLARTLANASAGPDADHARIVGELQALLDAHGNENIVRQAFVGCVVQPCQRISHNIRNAQHARSRGHPGRHDGRACRRHIAECDRHEFSPENIAPLTTKPEWLYERHAGNARIAGVLASALLHARVFERDVDRINSLHERIRDLRQASRRGARQRVMKSLESLMLRHRTSTSEV